MFGWKAAEAAGCKPPFVSPEKEGEFRHNLEEALRGNILTGIRITRRRKDGSSIDLSMSNAPVRDASGKVIGVIAIFADITDHVRAERALKESERRYHAIVENLFGIAYRLNDDFSPTHYHGAVKDLTGYTEEQLVSGNPPLENLILSGDRPYYRDFMERARAKPGSPVHLNYWMARADGKNRYMYQLIRFIAEDGRDAGHFEGFIYDTTESKLKENELSKIAEELNDTFDAINDGLFILTLDSTIVRSNRAMAALTGKTAGEMSGRKCFEVVHGMVCSIDKCPMMLMKKSRKRESMVLAAGGRFFGIRVDPRFDKAGNLAGAVHLMTDITEKIQVDTEKQKTSDTLNAIIQASPLAIVTHEIGGRVITWNKAAELTYGWTAAEAIGNTPPLIPGEELEQSRQEVKTVLGGELLHETQAKRVCKDGKAIDVSVSRAPLRNSSGRVWAYLSISSDITDRLHAVAELQQTNELLSALINGSPFSIISFDTEGRVLTWNHAAEQIYGWTTAEATGRRLPPVPDSERAESDRSWSEVLSGVPSINTRSRRIRKDGTVIEVLINRTPLRNPSGIIYGLLSMSSDITKQAGMEEAIRQRDDEVRQLQKMEAIGRLAGGMAHDFNNIMTAIMGYTDLLINKLEPGSPAWRNAEEIARGANRAAALSTQLLTFSRRQVFKRVTLNLNEILAESEPMFRQLAPPGVELRIAPADGLGGVLGNFGMIQQVLINLVINACEAMPKGGILVIETANVEMDADYSARHAGAPPGPYVVISVSDTGAGMDEKARAHLFEPFFTTKETGTGLGLSTAYGIVLQMGGHFSVYSEPGKGTSFKVYLPRATGPAEKAAAEPPRSTGTVQGSETILVVEDRDDVREMAVSTLSENGYRILSASSGEEALRVAAECRTPIHLLLTDLVMPGMNGQELALKMAQSIPDLRILLMSDYTDTLLTANRILEQGAAFLQKPFSASTLARKVRGTLDAPLPKITTSN